MQIVPPENPARRTFLLDAVRAVPGGCVETLGLTFVVLIAVRVFDAEPWQKATLVAASSFGLLLSLFPVQLVRRTGCSVNVAIALLYLMMWPSVRWRTESRDGEEDGVAFEPDPRPS